MCELMGLCFAQPVSAGFSIREFSGRDSENADGWGLAWYPDCSVSLIKEPVSWRQSKHTGFLESYHALRSSIYIAHVRHKTVGGEPTHADTHPFVRELNGAEYCFAHNGTLLELSRKGLHRFHPLGTTDSEFAFCLLLESLAERKSLEGATDWQWLHEELSRFNRRGKLNCLLSDGKRLYCYHDMHGHKGLSLRKIRTDKEQPRSLGDEELHFELEAGAANHGYAVATHPLSATGWHAFHHGELLVLDAGVIAFSSHRQGQSAPFVSATA